MREYVGMQFFPLLLGFEPTTSASRIPFPTTGYNITSEQQWDSFLLSSLSKVLYNPFHSYNDLKWKSFQL